MFLFSEHLAAAAFPAMLGPQCVGLKRYHLANLCCTVCHSIGTTLNRCCTPKRPSDAKPLSLKTVTPSNKEPRLLTFHFSYAIIVFGDNELKFSKCYDRNVKMAFRTSKCCNRYGKKQRENSKCYYRLGKTAKPPYFEEIRVFKGRLEFRTSSTTTRDRNLQFRGAVSTGFSAFSPVFMCNLVRRAP